MRAMVTGGGGFLGRRIIELLCARGDDVSFVARRRYPEVEALGAKGVEADIRDAATLDGPMRQVDVVFHVAGKTGYWGARREFWSVNVDGACRILEAARRAEVGRLVYTSTPSVVGYARDVENGDPELPYATSHESVYAESKAVAERLVLAANGTGIATVALRPHLIIGPGDDALMPRVVRRAARGMLRVIGNGTNKVDLTYIDNAAWAHLDAANALTGQTAFCAGKAYFISNGEPVFLWAWLNELLRELGLPALSKTLSYRKARLAGSLAETLWTALRIPGEPPITRFLASALARSHWYDMGPASRDLGYRARVPMEEATRRTAEWLGTKFLATCQPSKEWRDVQPT